MDFSQIKSASMLTITIEILCKINIIKLPKSANYSLQDILTVLVHAATSTSNSSESASNDLKLRNPDKKIPSSDTINNYIKSNSNEYILSSFRKITKDIVKMLNLRVLLKMLLLRMICRRPQRRKPWSAWELPRNT